MKRFVCTLTLLVATLPAGAFAQDAVADFAADVEQVLADGPNAMIEYGEEASDDLAGVVATLGRYDREVRKEAPNGLDCVTGSLDASVVLKDAVEVLRERMTQRIDQGDLERAGAELRKIAVARLRGDQLEQKATMCIVGLGAGKWLVTVEETVGDPQADVAPIVEFILDTTADPPVMSPFE